MGVTDPIKESTPAAIRLLREEGIQIVMVTGDNRTTAQAVARSLGSSASRPEFFPSTRAKS